MRVWRACVVCVEYIVRTRRMLPAAAHRRTGAQKYVVPCACMCAVMYKGLERRAFPVAILQAPAGNACVTLSVCARRIDMCIAALCVDMRADMGTDRDMDLCADT